MSSDFYEKSFSDFLERKEYDQAQNALFEIVRAAFTAGWLAAGGEALQPQRIFEIVYKNPNQKSKSDD